MAILLISADYLASDFIANNELPPLLKGAEEGGVTILPLVVKPCRFEQNPGLGVYQAFNRANPLSKLSEDAREDVLLELVDRVAGLVTSQETGNG